MMAAGQSLCNALAEWQNPTFERQAYDISREVVDVVKEHHKTQQYDYHVPPDCHLRHSQKLRIVQDEALELFRRKHYDHGESFTSAGPVAVLVRLGDKKTGIH